MLGAMPRAITLGGYPSGFITVSLFDIFFSLVPSHLRLWLIIGVGDEVFYRFTRRCQATIDYEHVARHKARGRRCQPQGRLRISLGSAIRRSGYAATIFSIVATFS